MRVFFQGKGNAFFFFIFVKDINIKSNGLKGNVRLDHTKREQPGIVFWVTL